MYPDPELEPRLEMLSKVTFSAINEWQDKLVNATGGNWDMPIKEYVWSDENGHRINSFSKSFTSLLESCDLLYDAHNCKRVIGSLRHTYGTFRKNLGEVDTYELAIQMGTSPEMIQQHYIHHDDYDRSTAVTRIKKSIWFW